MLDVIAGGRPAGDILSRVVRISLGGREFVLPVRSIRANREWKAALDARTAAIVDSVSRAGDDADAVLASLASENVTPFIDLLVSYAPGVLTTQLIEEIEPDPSMDVIRACQEVWLAASPLVAIGLEALKEMAAGSEPTSSPPPNGISDPTMSNSDSPTSSLSGTSTPPPTGSQDGEPTSSTPRSSRSGRATSSPPTSASSPAGSVGANALKGRRSGSKGPRSKRP